MARLTIRCGAQVIPFDFPPPMPLAEALAQSGVSIPQPCGGRGVCGKCAVVLKGSVSAPSTHECSAGARLSCQVILLGDAEVILPQEQQMSQIETGQAQLLASLRPMPGRYGAAVDIGTTTLALRLYDLSSGQCIGMSAMLNPQTSVAADVIGRMDAAMKGKLPHLQQQITDAIAALLTHAAAQAGMTASQVASLTITGNTTMLYLLAGRDPVSLARAPFLADHLFGEACTLLERTAYLPRCLHAFVGADTATALLASGMLDKPDAALLCDIGTNGELALWKDGQLYVTSTAAGPAFEGAGISCGVGSVTGAIDQVDIVNGQLHVHTIGGSKAVGLCGSGLVDAVAALLDLEQLDETGALEDDGVLLSAGVILTQADIRSVQLAKAAIAAGIGCLMDKAGCCLQDIDALYLAGGFGSHLSIPHAVRIGLIPADMMNRVRVIGNAALDGAARLLLDTHQRDAVSAFARSAIHVDLGGNSTFSQRYIEEMMFPELG